MLRIDAPCGRLPCDTSCPRIVKTRTSTLWSVTIIIDLLPVYMAMPLELSTLLRLWPSIAAPLAGCHLGWAASIFPGNMVAQLNNIGTAHLFIISSFEKVL